MDLGRIRRRVPPICPVRRSKSFPNESETTDHAAELEDFLSSRSGVTELSIDKPETDEDEDHWRDASPHTPTCSPTKRPSKFPEGSVPLKPTEIDLREFQPISPLHEKDVIIIESGASPPSKKLAMKYVQNATTGIEKVAPKVKLKEEIETSTEKVADSSTIDKKRSLKRMDSVDRMSSSRETLDKSDSADKGAKKKIFKKKDSDRRSTRRKTEEDIETFMDASKTETERSWKRRDTEEVVTRSREERKSLREQECIERVTEFLTKHSVLCYSDPSVEPDVNVQEKGPSSFKEPEKEANQAESIDKSREDAHKSKEEKRVEGSDKTPSSIELDKPMIATLTMISPITTTASDKPTGSTVDVKTIVTSPETEAAPVKRRSSMRKKPSPFSRESSRESLLDDAKKEVRIQESVEEIFFEDVSEQMTGILPEVQLVKARIITAEEAAANRVEETQTRIEVHSPPEVATVPDSIRIKSCRVPSPETVTMSQLQPVSLAKSTSENTLVETDGVADENKVSERNLKAEILLDLSKMSDAGEEAVQMIDGERKEKMLSRTGSEGSKRAALRAQMKSKERDGFKIGSLALPNEPELTVLMEHAAGEKRTEKTRSEKVDEGEKEQVQRPEEKELPSRRPEDQEVELPTKLQPCEEKFESIEEETKDYESVEWQQKRSSKEASSFKPDEDSLISKEHSLEYQSQTLESQSDHLLISSSLEELLRSVPDTWPGQLDREEEGGHSFKETQYSPREKRDAETQTEQLTKSTQYSPQQSITSPIDSAKDSPLHISRVRYQSPRKEVETQTQGENKSVQCCLDEVGGLSRTQDLEDSFDSPSKSEKSSIKESKSIQCIPRDFSTPDKDGLIEDQGKSRTSPRKEVEVQTYQESKGIQCSDDELLEADRVECRIRFESSSKTEEEVSSLSCCEGSTGKFATVVFVDEPVEMTVTQRDHEGNVSWSKHWGPERLVEIYREPKTSLGLSIVGGKVDLHNGSSSKSQNISGIFIKNVLPNSPAGRTGELKIGDRIIEVDGVDLRHSTHERAVEVIQAAGNPVRLLVQSLVHLNENDTDGQVDEAGRLTRRPSGRNRSGPTGTFGQRTSPARSTTPEATQASDYGDKQSTSRSDFRRQSTRASDGAGSSSRRSSMKKSIRKKAPSPPSSTGILKQVSEEKEDHAAKSQEPPKKKYSSDESSEEEDTRELEGNVYTKAGMEISRKSAGNVKRTKAEIEADPEQEDEYGYTAMKVQKKYRSLGHQVLMVKVEKDRRGLGISLAGHKDRNRMAVFICGLNPRGSAHKGGELSVGDEILEVNGRVLQGRCHLNASAMIKGMAGTNFKIVVLRRKKALDDMSVKPITQFPPSLEENTFNQYKGVRNIPVKKGQYGLGIMIIEGKHAEVGQGIFISDIQEGSAAEQAGLQVGDLILAVNMDCLLGSTYDEATSLLKKAEGVVTLVVCNPNQSKVAKEEEDRAKGIIPEEKPVVQKEPEKPKEPEPPQDPKDCKILTGRDTTIEFQKEKDKGIGFTIAGGSDTPLKAVFIIEVFPDGAAGKDGRLQSGDEILDFCSKSFKEIEHEKAHATVLKASGTITMVVHREEKSEEEIEVELQKKSGKGAGLCLTGYKSGKGAYVSDLLPGGSALECGKICKGDRVIAVGGTDVREAPVEDIAVHVKVSNPVQLKLARYKSAKQ